MLLIDWWSLVSLPWKIPSGDLILTEGKMITLVKRCFSVSARRRCREGPGVFCWPLFWKAVWQCVLRCCTESMFFNSAVLLFRNLSWINNFKIDKSLVHKDGCQCYSNIPHWCLVTRRFMYAATALVFMNSLIMWGKCFYYNAWKKEDTAAGRGWLSGRARA